MRLGFAAQSERRHRPDSPPRAYDFDLDESTDCTAIDLRPAVRAAVVDLLNSRAANTIAGRFHATLIAAAAAVVGRATDRHGDLPVVLTGGCFQNQRLLSGARAVLGAKHRVHVHRQIPPNDGGIALGQAAVAAAIARGDLGPDQPAAAKRIEEVD